MPGPRETLAKIALLGLTVTIGACQSVPSDATHPGLAFAQTSCAGCHAVEGQGSSPNPLAPPFPAIVNKQGLSSDTLGAWLRDAHNYPDEMRFTLDSAKIDDLVAYMVTLRDPHYRPEI